LFRPQDQGGARSAGKHMELDWSNMVKAYDGETAFYPHDGFNFWVLEGNVSTFNHVNDVLSGVAKVAPLLPEADQKSWFTGMKLALVNDFHLWAFFGENGLFGGNSTSTKTDEDMVKVINDGQYFGAETITDMDDFKTKFHSSGKQFITQTSWMDYIPNKLLEIFKTEDKSEQIPYYKIMKAMTDESLVKSGQDLLTKLGYTNTLAPRIKDTFKIVKVMRIFYSTFELHYKDQFHTLIKTMFVVMSIVIIALLACLGKIAHCLCTRKRKE